MGKMDGTRGLSVISYYKKIGVIIILCVKIGLK